jgi:peptidoglycan LD-endopeptidase LytH
MRAAAAFALGFAAGMLSLAAALWATGRLHAGPPPAAATVASRLPDAPPALLPDLAAGPQMHAPPQPPLPERGGEADRSTGLAMPLAGIDPKRLPDTFNDARTGHRHEALDIAAPRGTPVTAVAEGNVVKLFTSREGGLTVYQFDDRDRWCYYYAHLDHYARGLKEGMLLRQGDVLGYVGTTGNAPKDSPHLHFAVFKLGPEKKWWEGKAVDPLPLLR